MNFQVDITKGYLPYEEEIRMEALRLASTTTTDPNEILETAKVFAEYIITGTSPKEATDASELEKETQ